MKKSGVDRNQSCFTLQERKGTSLAHPLKDPVYAIPGGLLRAGIFSLLLHGVLVLALILGIQPDVRERSLPVYRVTIRPLQVLEKEMRPKSVNVDPGRRLPAPPAKIQTQREQHERVQEIRPKEVVFPEKETNQGVPAPVQRAAAYVPPEELEPLSQPQEKEEKIREPIPLPMAASADSNTSSGAESEEIPHILLSSSRLEEDHKNITPGKGQGEGPGTGSGGSELGRSGDGTGGGRGDSPGGGFSSGGVEKGQGTGEGAFGKRGYGSEGSGNGKGSGRGGGGQGGPGNDGAGEPRPTYAKNPAPVYPREAKNKSYEGEVLLRVEVLSNGRVGQIEVKKSSGHGVLDQSALIAVKEWRFIPAMKGDVAIPIWVTIPITYRLQ